MVNNPANPPIATLLNSVRGALKKAVDANYVGQAKADDAYEAYLFSLVVQAAVSEGAASPPQFQDAKLNPTADLVFRRGPGRIAATSTRLFTHAVLDFSNAPALEVHLGVLVNGKAPVVMGHEFDICVLPQEEAKRCRSRDSSGKSKNPASSKVFMMVECKYYPQAKPLEVAVAASFRGVTDDLTTKYCFFAVTAMEPAAEKFLGKFTDKIGHGVVPPTSANYAATQFRSQLQNAFHQYTRAYL